MKCVFVTVAGFTPEMIASRCSSHDIADYLRSIKLSAHVQMFESVGINGNTLLLLAIEEDHASLKELGVTKRLERIQIITKFKKFLMTKWPQGVPLQEGKCK